MLGFMPKARAVIANLPKSVSVFEIKRPKGTQWRVQLGKRFTGGKRVTHDCDSVAEAKEWIFGPAQKKKASTGLSLLQLQKQAGATAFTLAPAQIGEAIDAFKRLNGTMTLTEAVDFAIKHARPSGGTISVEEAIKNAKLSKQYNRKTYRSNVVQRWRRFAKWLPAAKRKAINSVTQLDVRRFLTECKLKPVGEGNMCANLSVLFSWAVDNHHMTENPCKGIKVVKSKRKPPRILSIDEMKHLLKLSQQKLQVLMKAGRKKPSIITVNPGDLIPYLAIGAWAGVRPEESVLTRWEYIDFKRKHIDLPPEITKDHERRIIPMEPVLIKWLKKYRPENGQGKIIVNHEWKFRAFVKAANFSPWPHDCLRKSYGSYHLAKFRNAGDTADNMGHENPKTFYRHYRDVVKEKADIDAYWDLTPKTVLPEK